MNLEPTKRELPIHPIAQQMPPMTPWQFDTFLADVREHGIREPVWLYEGSVLDGRHRVKAAEMLNIPFQTRTFKGSRDEAVALVKSENIYRRQLTRLQHQTIIRDAIKTMPDASLRQIASKTASTPTTVAKARAKMESNGQVSKVDTSKGRDGKNYPRVPTHRKDGRAYGLREGAKTRVERVYEISTLASQGHNAEQVAEEIGMDVKTVRTIASREKIAFAVPHRKKQLSVPNLVSETVTIIATAGRGLRFVKMEEIEMTKEEAAEMVEECKEGMKQLRQLVSRLTEIANHG